MKTVFLFVVADSEVGGGDLSEFLNDGHGSTSTQSVAESTRSEAIPIQRPKERHVSVSVRDHHNSVTTGMTTRLSWPLAANQTLPGVEYLAPVPSQGRCILPDPLDALSISWPLGNTTNSVGDRSMLQAMARREEHLPQSYLQYRRPRTVSLSSTASEVLYFTNDDDESPTGTIVNGMTDTSFSGTEQDSENGPTSVARFLTVPDMTDPSHLTEDLGEASFHIDLQTSELYSNSDIAAEPIKPSQQPTGGLFAAAAFPERSFAMHTMPLHEPSISVTRQPPHVGTPHVL